MGIRLFVAKKKEVFVLSHVFMRIPYSLEIFCVCVLDGTRYDSSQYIEFEYAVKMFLGRVGNM